MTKKQKNNKRLNKQIEIDEFLLDAKIEENKEFLLLKQKDKKYKEENKKYHITQRNKYIEELGFLPYQYGVNFQTEEEYNKKSKKYEKQIKNYGIDERVTWNYDARFVENLYTGLKMYYEKSKEVVDLSFHKVKFEDKTYTQEEAILQILKWLEQYLIYQERIFLDDDADQIIENVKRSIKLFSEIWAAC